MLTSAEESTLVCDPLLAPATGKTGNHARGQYCDLRGVANYLHLWTPAHLIHHQLYFARTPPLVAGGEPPTKQRQWRGMEIIHPTSPDAPPSYDVPPSSGSSSTSNCGGGTSTTGGASPVTPLLSITSFARVVTRKGSPGCSIIVPLRSTIPLPGVSIVRDLVLLAIGLQYSFHIEQPVHGFNSPRSSTPSDWVVSPNRNYLAFPCTQ